MRNKLLHASPWSSPYPADRVMTRLLLLLLPALAQPFRRKMVEESSPACPGSPSPRHAKCSLRIEFEQPCAEVQAEVVARLRGGQGWRCPKTHPGQYTLISASAGAVRGSRETGPGSTPPGPGKSYTDSFGFTFAERALGGAGCTVHACSESQGPSGCDYSTNYCNVRNLYCNSAEGCRVLRHELTSKEQFGASCYHAPKCKGSLKDGLETNIEMCRR